MGNSPSFCKQFLTLNSFKAIPTKFNTVPPKLCRYFIAKAKDKKSYP